MRLRKPALGTYGNIGPRNIKGIGTWDLDVALARTFQLGETQQLEFRAEAYNLTNSFRAVNPEDNIRRVAISAGSVVL